MTTSTSKEDWRPRSQWASNALGMPKADQEASGIYAIVHEPSKSIYVGSSVGRIIGRLAEHVYKLKMGKHHNKELQKLYDICGRDGLEYRLLEAIDGSAPSRYYLAREAYWSQQWMNKGYRTINAVLRSAARAAAQGEPTIITTGRNRIPVAAIVPASWVKERPLSEQQTPAPPPSFAASQVATNALELAGGDPDTALDLVIEATRLLNEERKRRGMGDHK